MSNNQFENDLLKYLNFEPCRSPPHSIGELYELSREEVSEFFGENSERPSTGGHEDSAVASTAGRENSAGPSTGGFENSVGPSTAGLENSEAFSSAGVASSGVVKGPALFPDRRRVHRSATPNQNTYLSPATLGWIHPFALPAMYPTCSIPEGTATANRSSSRDIELEF